MFHYRSREEWEEVATVCGVLAVLFVIGSQVDAAKMSAKGTPFLYTFPTAFFGLCALGSWLYSRRLP